MVVNVFQGNRRRRLTAGIGLLIGALGCGGGGAAVDAGIATGPGTAPESPASPPAPSSNVVTTVDRSFSPATITVAQGASVTWQIAGNTHNVTFGTNKPAGGDALNTAPGGTFTRTFATAGTYPYECTLHSGMIGQVVVTDGGAPPPPPPPPSSGIVVQATPSAFTPERLEFAPGGTVTWEFSGGALGIVFEDAAPPGGNIPESSPGASVSRTFPNAGDYDYYSSKNREVKGRIRVR